MTTAPAIETPAAAVVAPAPKSRRKNGALAERQAAPPARVDTSPEAILQLAISQGAPLDQLEKFMALRERHEANEAKKAFNAAFAAFKSEAVVIVKGTTITDGPLKGKKHANLFDVVDAATPYLSKHGLAINWKLTKDEPGWMEVTCTLRHVNGHAESVSMGGAPDTGPGRNAIQARGSTKSYLERYTALGILGLAASDSDNDGNGGAGLARITEDQAATLEALIEEVKADKPKFLRYLKVQKLEELSAAAYPDAVAALEQKRGKS